MPHDEKLAERVRSLMPYFGLLENEEITEKKMFGGLCFLLNGKMVLGIDASRVMIRLSDSDLAQGLESGRVVPMDFTGKPMRNFAFLSPGSWDSDQDLIAWFDKSAAYVREHMFPKPKAKK